MNTRYRCEREFETLDVVLPNREHQFAAVSGDFTGCGRIMSQRFFPERMAYDEVIRCFGRLMKMRRKAGL